MSRFAFRRVLACTVAAGLAVVVTAAPAFAHEQRQVGAYQLTVGWLHEPTYAGVQNSVQITIKDAKGNAVDDLGDPPSLQVTAVTGGQTSDPLTLEPSFDPDTGDGTHGEFDAAIIPTRPGDYTFHFTGTINGQKIDEQFTSSDKTFDTVKEPSAIEFPAKDPSTGQLATSVDRLNPRVDSATSFAKSAKSKASSAGTLALVGVVLAAIAAVLAAAALLRGRRR